MFELEIRTHSTALKFKMKDLRIRVIYIRMHRRIFISKSPLKNDIL